MIKLKYETLKFVRIKITSLFILVYSYEDYRKNLHKKEHFFNTFIIKLSNKLWGKVI